MRHFTKEEKQRAMDLYFEEKLTTQAVVERLGYPTRQNLERWLKKDPRYGAHFRHGTYPVSLKVKAVEMYYSGQYTVEEIAAKLNLPVPGTIYSWIYKARDGGFSGLISRTKSANMPKKKTSEIPEDLQKLKERCEELELDNAILRETITVLKKDLGADPLELSNREKSQVIGALQMTMNYPLQKLMKKMNLASSSYYYHQKQIKKEDPLVQVRWLIQEIFEESRGTYGYRRIWYSLKNRGIQLSEKVVRRIMTEKSLRVQRKKKRAYSSYQGEITPAPDNLLQRDFHAALPNEKWLTDITELVAADGKVYLSPMIDCYDGLVVSWKMSDSPNAELTNGMLKEALYQLKPGQKPIIHTDRGVHYRWASWIEMIKGSGLTRSMSKKACSPDNAACEGFFGRLKCEMYYEKHWEQKSKQQLMMAIDQYIHWYNEKRIKISLGGRSPLEYRKSLGLAS